MRRLCRFSLPRDGFELLDLVLMLHAAHKALAVDRVAAVAGKAFAPVLRAAFELCGKVRLADERVQIERRLLPRAAVEVDAADLRSVHAAAFIELQLYECCGVDGAEVSGIDFNRRAGQKTPFYLDALICEPDFAAKLKSGAQDGSKCLACNGCYTIYRKRFVRCVQHQDEIEQFKTIPW